MKVVGIKKWISGTPSIGRIDTNVGGISPTFVGERGDFPIWSLN
jgi:hypothetical protein